MSNERKLDDRGRPIISAAEREANKAFKKIEAEKAITEHQTTQKAIYDNRDRLKAERIAREAEEPKSEN